MPSLNLFCHNFLNKTNLSNSDDTDLSFNTGFFSNLADKL